MPQYPKHPDAKLGHHKKDSVELVVRDPREITVPKPPFKGHPRAMIAWKMIWESPVAEHEYIPSDVFGIEMLFGVIDEIATLQDEKKSVSGEKIDGFIKLAKQYILTPSSRRSHSLKVARTANELSQVANRKRGRSKGGEVDAESFLEPLPNEEDLSVAGLTEA